MPINVEKEIGVMKRMTVPELRLKFEQVAGEPTRSRHKDYLIRRIIWQLQANEQGNLSERARRRATELAQTSDIRLTPPKAAQYEPLSPPQTVIFRASDDHRLPMPGASITREYKGVNIVVKVRPKGFEYEGEIYRTLSAVARAVTGTHWNGYHFFGLNKKG